MQFKYFRKTLFLGLVIISILGIFACSKKMDTNTPVITQPANTNRYLALGDSYTIGESVDPSQRFPAQTVDLLRSYGLTIANPEYIATTGWTTADLLNAINGNASISTNYAVVSLLIGVNNQYQGRTLSEYKTQFTTLLEDAIKFAGNDKNKVFVVSIPDYSVTPFASGSDTAKIAREIDQFNAANLAISNTYGVHYLDITPISREAKKDPSLVAGDGLHPSGAQYSRWAALLAPMMKTVLK